MMTENIEAGMPNQYSKPDNATKGETLVVVSLLSKQEARIEDLINRIQALELRNIDVDRKKSWEGSYTRMFCIIIVTFIIIFLYLRFSLHVDHAAENAVVPAIGFTLSAWSLSIIRPIWEKLTGLNDGHFELQKKLNLKMPPSHPPLPIC